MPQRKQMDIPSPYLEGGLGVALIWFCIKYLIPIIKGSVDSASARTTMDATLHRLYTEQLEQIKALAEELMKARTEIASLTAKLTESERRVSQLLQQIQELENRTCK